MVTRIETLRAYFDPETETGRIRDFLKSNLVESGANGLIVGISGGVDSAVTVALSKRSVGLEKTYGMLLFEDKKAQSSDHEDSKKLAAELKIKTLDISITPVINAFQQLLENALVKPTRLTMANLKARTRMSLLYAIANEKNLLVVGTGDRSESLIGYFTKFGDGGADIFPLGHLYKTEVRELARYLRIPTTIIEKPSSPNLWEGQRATDEIPADYEVLDKILTKLYDSRIKPEQISSELGVSFETVQEVMKRNKKTKHKREYPRMIVP